MYFVSVRIFTECYEINIFRLDFTEPPHPVPPGEVMVGAHAERQQAQE